MNYIIGKIYSLELTHPSYSWENSLFICLKTDEDTIWGCKINNKGIPQKFDDGTYMSFCTGINNLEIKETELYYILEDGFKHN